MLTMIWAELESISAQINLIQGERAAAKVKNDLRRVAELAAELVLAVTTRDDLVARIGELVGEGAKSGVMPGRILAAAA